jgi:hypothetical protein
MAGAFTKGNASVLSERLGRAPSEGELYIAHFLGVGGAARLIGLAGSNPNSRAADYFPNAAQANPSIFYDRSTGAARSLAQVRDILTARYDVARGNQDYTAATALTDPAAATDAASSATESATATAPDTAGIASAFAAAIPTPGRHASLPRFVRRRSPHRAARSCGERALGRPKSGHIGRSASAEIPIRRCVRSLQRSAVGKFLNQPKDSAPAKKISGE